MTHRRSTPANGRAVVPSVTHTALANTRSECRPECIAAVQRRLAYGPMWSTERLRTRGTGPPPRSAASPTSRAVAGWYDGTAPSDRPRDARRLS